MKFFITCMFIYFAQTVNAANCGYLKWESIAVKEDLTKIAFTNSKEKYIAIWNIATGVAKKLDRPNINIKELFFVDSSKLVAVGTRNGRGPYFQVWNLKTGSSKNLDNLTFRDMAGDIISNLSRNSRYVITSGQLFYGGWGYQVIDLKTGLTTLTFKNRKGQAQISDDLSRLYIVTQRGDHRSAYIEIFDVLEQRILYGDYLSSTYSRDDRMNWVNNKIIFSGYNALVFDAETKDVENLFSRGSLKSCSRDLSIWAHSSSYSGTSYTIRSKNPLYVRDLRPNEKTFASKLSQDGKKMLAVTESNKILLFNTDKETFSFVSECNLQ